MDAHLDGLRSAVYTGTVLEEPPSPLRPPLGVSEAAQTLRQNLAVAVVARTEVLDLVIAGLLAGGHILLVDVPGVGKTLLAKTLARSIHASFRRIQLTPDLLPADITGSAMYNQKLGDFVFAPGPLFAHIVLADEINRATPRTQAALLEAMGEAQVSVDSVTHPLPQPFLLIATQNPVETYGTFPLPEAELDRFLLSVSLGYPDRAQGVHILELEEHEAPGVGPVLAVEEVLALQRQVRQVAVAGKVKEYIVALVEGSRSHPQVALGGSPRAAVDLQRASQAWAAMHNRDFVAPDDVKATAPAVLSHRLVLVASGSSPSAGEMVDEVLRGVPVPL